jgi:hypothetical protein
LIANGEVLQTIAEIGAAFAGFAALASAIGLRAGPERSVDLSRLHIAVGGALIVVVGGIVPFAVAAYSPPQELAWRASAGIVLFLNYAYTAAYFPRLRRGDTEPAPVPWLFWVLEVALQVPLLALLFGYAGGLEGAVYLTGVTLLLCQGAFVFLRLITSIIETLIDD